MTVATKPNVIELTDFSAGWVPDFEPAAVPENALLEVKNLLPDIGTGQPQVRPGYAALANMSLTGREIRSLFGYHKKNGTSYLIAVATLENGASVAANVEVWAYNLSAGTAARISPLNKAWIDDKGRHFGFVVDDVFYGGSTSDPMYSWDGTTWTDSVGVPAVDADWIDDKAYRKGDRVRYRPTVGDPYKNYHSVGTWREDVWENNVTYVLSDRVSVKDGGGGTYWRTFKCVKKHKSATAANKPGSGTDWLDYWKLTKMAAPLDDDKKPNQHRWLEIPDTPVTNIATFHGNRMFARNDNVRTDRLIFSAQSAVKDADIGAAWNPKDWRAGGSDGAGWQDFKTKEGDAITALKSFGFYLIVLKRWSVHVIAGINPETWQPRKLEDVGAVSIKAVTEHEGLVYFLGERGFYVTDGTEAKPVPGEEKVRDWLKRVLDRNVTLKDVTLWSYGGFVWISLPTESNNKPDRVLVYDPMTQSFWKQTLNVQTAALGNLGGMDQMYFTRPTDLGTYKSATFSWVTPGSKPVSFSTRSTGALQNSLYDPSFEARATVTYIGSWSRPSFSWPVWTNTHAKVKKEKTPEAARRGFVGAEITNNRLPDPNDATARYEGIKQTQTVSGNQVLSGHVRRPAWKKHNARPDIKLLRNGTGVSGGSLNWVDLGRGWWRVWTTFTGTGTGQDFGILVKPGFTVQVDQMMLHAGTTPEPYFDGDGGDTTAGSVVGIDAGRIYQFGQLDTATNMPVATDAGIDIPWSLRTAWSGFGAVREERQIRNVWVLVRGNPMTVIRLYEDYGDEVKSVRETTPTDDAAAIYAEGFNPPDAFAVTVQVEGLAGPAAVLGVGINTVPRRWRSFS